MSDDRKAVDRRPRSLTLELLEESTGIGERSAPNDELLKPHQVAALFGVTATTIARWTRTGRLRAAASTLGGHRRYLRTDALSLRDDAKDDVDPAREKMEEDAARLYEQGWSIRQVAEQFECGYAAMRTILLKRTSLRGRGGKAG